MAHQQSRSSQTKMRTGFARRLIDQIAWRNEDRRKRHAIESLLELDDATLDDLGLSRGELRHAVGFRRPFAAFTPVRRGP